MARRNPRTQLMTDDIIQNYGMIVSKKDLAQILGYTSMTTVDRWIERQHLRQVGRKKHYYAGDIAQVIVENGGVVT